MRSTTRSIYVITGDNGASGEGTLNGTWNESLTMTGMIDVETPEFLRERLDTFGTPESYPQYSLGWAHAMDTPYQWTKRVASHWGGTRNGLIVHWPRGIKARGEMRHQFHHVIDVAPTFLEVARLPASAAGERRRPAANRGRQHGLQLRRLPTRRSGTRRSISRSSAIAASTTRAGRR